MEKETRDRAKRFLTPESGRVDIRAPLTLGVANGNAVRFQANLQFLLQIRLLFFIMHPCLRKVVSLIFKRGVVKHFFILSIFRNWNNIRFFIHFGGYGC